MCDVSQVSDAAVQPFRFALGLISFHHAKPVFRKPVESCLGLTLRTVSERRRVISGAGLIPVCDDFDYGKAVCDGLRRFILC